jgi:ribosomal protein S18 acetylase RimI-like enzyme
MSEENTRTDAALPLGSEGRLRRATRADLPRILALERSGFDVAHHEDESVYALRIDVFPQGAWMVERHGQGVGCLFTEVWKPQALPTASRFALGHDIRTHHDARDGTELYISSMTLDPSCRGLGLGRAVLSAVMRQMARESPSLRSAILLVNERWLAARRIYDSLGFVRIASLPAFFGDGDGIVMRREGLDVGAH